ncbi:MAG: glycosyltransferase, partial [Planctomycetota bacterium]|nr:glycosyltransferase [Planctomycetota bacterium]
LDLLHAHYALPHAVSALLARDAARTEGPGPPPRVLTTLHGTDITIVGNEPSYAPLIRYALRASDAVTAVSHDLARRTREGFGPGPCAGADYGAGADNCAGADNRAGPDNGNVADSGGAGASNAGQLDEIEVIPNFVDLDLFRPARPTGLAPSGSESGGGSDPGPPTVVHVSNFRPVKRVPWLVEAFADEAASLGARLVLVGDGPEQGAAREAARRAGIANQVTFLGTRDALPELLAPATVFALASSEEAFGLSALEAMACGTPVVATRVGGVSEVVENGLSGLLVPAEDRPAFARALGELVGDRDRATAMGRAARQRAETHFDRQTVVSLYEDLYHRVITKDRRGRDRRGQDRSGQDRSGRDQLGRGPDESTAPGTQA